MKQKTFLSVLLAALFILLVILANFAGKLFELNPNDNQSITQTTEEKINADDPIAQYNRARDYYHGKNGLPRNKAKAVELLQKAAEQGYAEAQSSLGNMYYRGEGGIRRNKAKAAELYQKAAEQGNPDALYNLAHMYNDGEGGLPKDKAKAAELFQKAAEQMDANSQ